MTAPYPPTGQLPSTARQSHPSPQIAVLVLSDRLSRIRQQIPPLESPGQATTSMEIQRVSRLAAITPLPARRSQLQHGGDWHCELARMRWNFLARTTPAGSPIATQGDRYPAS